MADDGGMMASYLWTRCDGVRGARHALMGERRHLGHRGTWNVPQREQDTYSLLLPVAGSTHIYV